MYKIIKEKGSRYVEYCKSGIQNVKGKRGFLLIFEIPGKSFAGKDGDVHFVLDPKKDNHFEFFVDEDYPNKKMTITIKGGKNSSLALKGYEIK